MQIPENNYYYSINQARFWSFLVVFIFHCFLYFKPTPASDIFLIFQYVLSLSNEGGDLGVSFFFVLSGFLITLLLLKEKQSTQNISFQHFYGRRALRIIPLYLFVLLVSIIILPAKLPLLYQTVSLKQLLNYLFMMGNFDIFWHGYPPNAIGTLWSIAVEEQFYLLWPFIVWLSPKKWFPWVCLLMIACSFTYNQISRDIYRKFHTLMAIQYLCVGGLAAFYQIYQSRYIKPLYRIKYLLVLFVFLFSMLSYKWIFWKLEIPYFTYRPFVSLYIALIYALMIILLAKKPEIKPSSPVLNSLGNLSYGLYLWHMPVIVLLTPLGYKINLNKEILFVVQTALSLLISLGLSYLSYLYIEGPFLKLKRHLMPKQA